MKITNRMNLPEPLVRLCTPRPPSPTRISVTQLIGPPHLRRLTLAHWDALEEDVADRLWAIMGTAMHALLEQHGGANALAEEHLEYDLAPLGYPDYTLTGRPDYYDADDVLWDWKFTSLWALRDGLKSEWMEQINTYAWLFRRHSFPVRALRVLAVFRDWSKSDEMRGVPPAQVYEVPMMSDEEAEQYIRQRLDLHVHPYLDEVCTPKERWERPTVYAVQKRGRKRAVKLCDTRAEADALVAAKGAGHYVQERRGESVRCAHYCSVARFCAFGQQVLAALDEGGGDDAVE